MQVIDFISKRKYLTKSYTYASYWFYWRYSCKKTCTI